MTRLEEIKAKLSKIWVKDLGGTITREDCEWLMEQLEKAEKMATIYVQQGDRSYAQDFLNGLNENK